MKFKIRLTRRKTKNIVYKRMGTGVPIFFYSYLRKSHNFAVDLKKA